jgi:hypothetical protein
MCWDFVDGDFIAAPSNNLILYPIAQNRHTDESRYPESLSHWIPCQARNDKVGSGIVSWNSYNCLNTP